MDDPCVSWWLPVTGEIQRLYDLLYFCQEGQRVAIVGSRSDDDPVRNQLYVPQEEDEFVQEFIGSHHDDGQLLIITGSAGDGKSALLQRGTKLADGDVIPDERVNMDATSSRSADEDYDDRLNDFFSNVMPAVESESGLRSALAINYGLAVDFFRLRENEDTYPAIWEVVQESQAESRITKNNITVLNLSHRRAYQTHPEKLEGGLIREILNRFDPTHDESPFSEAYAHEAENCPAGEDCLLYKNLSILTDDDVKDRIASLFAGWSIVTGSYLNPRMIIDRISKTVLPSAIQTSTSDSSCPVGAAMNSGALEPNGENMIWNTIFRVLDSDKPRSSFIDPASRTTFERDQEILQWNADTNELMLALEEEYMEDLPARKMIQIYLRKQFLTNESDSFLREDPIFRQFAAALSYLKESADDMSDLRKPTLEFKETVETALENWTGQQSTGNLVEFRDARKSSTHRYLSKWDAADIELDIEDTRVETKRTATPGQIKLSISPAHSSDEPIKIPMSFPLYQLMYRVSEGYTPNSIDLNKSHSIQMLQSRLSDLTKKRDWVRIEDRTGTKQVTIKSIGDLGRDITAEGIE